MSAAATDPDAVTPSVVAVFGPTAVGKTEFALALARRLRGAGGTPVAVSADALQVYRGLEVLTGAATPAQREQLEHRLVGFVAVSESFSVGRYMPLAHAEIDGLLDQARTPMVVGGTGLYLRAALAHLDLAPPALPAVRRRWQSELARRGAADLHAELGRRAPAAAARVDPGDRSRIVRALELAEVGALPPARVDSQLWAENTRHRTLLIGLVMDRGTLNARIDARVEAMVAAGAIEEVRAAEAAGASPTARKALGYAELLAGDVAAMKLRSRQLAKRQLTWMRKLAGVHLVDVTARSPDEVADALDIIGPWTRRPSGAADP